MAVLASNRLSRQFFRGTRIIQERIDVILRSYRTAFHDLSFSDCASADRRNASVHQKFVTCTFSIIHTDLHLDIS